MKRIISLILVISVIFSLGVFNVSASSHWAQSVAEKLVEQGIVSGDQNGKLNLDGEITRAEFAKIINKSRKLTTKEDVNFPDVKEDKWYFEEMLIAKGNGYMTGDENGNANPEQNITRAEASVILARILGLDTSDVTSSLTDIDSIPDWAKGSVVALTKKGIINGYEDGSFKAGNTLKRGEGISLISNIAVSALPETLPEKEETKTNSASLNVNVSVSTGSSSGGGGGGGGGVITPQRFRASVPALRYNPEDGYNLMWQQCAGAQSYKVKIRITGETPQEFPVNNNSVDLYSYFVEYAKLRNNSIEDFYVAVKTVAIPGYVDSAYSQEIKVKAEFESISSPVLSVNYGREDGVGTATVNWDEVLNASDYEVVLTVSGAVKQDGFTVDKLNRVVSIPDASFVDDNTVLSVVAISQDPVYKNSEPTYQQIVIENYIKDDENKTVKILTSKGWDMIASNSLYKDYDVEIIDNITVTVPFSTFSGTLTGKKDEVEGKCPEITNKINSGIITELEGGTVKDLIIKGEINTEETGSIGTLCNTIYLVNDGNIIISGIENNCSLTALNTSYLGIVGCIDVSTRSGASNVTFKDCINKSSISGKTSVSGILGGIYSVKNAQDGDKVIFDECENFGEITSTGNYCAGIFGGYASEHSIEYNFTDCINHAKVSGAKYLGGISAAPYGTKTVVERCANYADITATSTFAGGIIGTTVNLNISESFNKGAVKGSSNYIGGLVGRTNGTVISVTDSYNTGNITGTGTTSVAGIVGTFYVRPEDITLKNVYTTGTVSHKQVRVTAYLSPTSTATKDIANIYYPESLAGEEVASVVDACGNISDSDAELPEGFSDTVWKFVEGGYPTLVNNSSKN